MYEEIDRTLSVQLWVLMKDCLSDVSLSDTKMNLYSMTVRFRNILSDH